METEGGSWEIKRKDKETKPKVSEVSAVSTRLLPLQHLLLRTPDAELT